MGFPFTELGKASEGAGSGKRGGALGRVLGTHVEGSGRQWNTCVELLGEVGQNVGDSSLQVLFKATSLDVPS